MRFAIEMYEAVRAVWPEHKPIGMRVSATDWVDGGWTPEETVVLAKELKKRGMDYMDVSSGGLSPAQKIPLAPGYQVPFAEKVKKESGITTMTVGLIAGYQQAEDIVASGKADLICLARAAIWDPRWAWHAAEELGAETPYAPKTMAGHPEAAAAALPEAGAGGGVTATRPARRSGRHPPFDRVGARRINDAPGRVRRQARAHARLERLDVGRRHGGDASGRRSGPAG